MRFIIDRKFLYRLYAEEFRDFMTYISSHAHLGRIPLANLLIPSSSPLLRLHTLPQIRGARPTQYQ